MLMLSSHLHVGLTGHLPLSFQTRILYHIMNFFFWMVTGRCGVYCRRLMLLSPFSSLSPTERFHISNQLPRKSKIKMFYVFLICQMGATSFHLNTPTIRALNVECTKRNYVSHKRWSCVNSFRTRFWQIASHTELEVSHKQLKSKPRHKSTERLVPETTSPSEFWCLLLCFL
jgi:hypothetical protein